MVVWSLLACAGQPKVDADPPSQGGARAVSDWPAACPDPADPAVHYKHETWAGRDVCERIRFACEEGQEPIVSPDGADCGCGCRDRRADDACDRDSDCEIVPKPCGCDPLPVNHAAGDRLRTEGAACAVTPSCAAPTGAVTCVDHRCTL
ncbi:MAG: hypothetical protein ABMB14_04970 [Myxococcota bacterium]